MLNTTRSTQRASTSHSLKITRTAVCRRSTAGLGLGGRRVALTAGAAADTALAIVGSLGIVGGTLFAALYVLERQSKEGLQRKIEQLQETIRERDQQLRNAAEQLDRAKEYGRENDMFRTRYADASRDILKLERALELKDGQLESFMVVAQRQIAYLESQVRELQKAGE
ncbi:hypothetical protein PLESTB_000566500 [Pleodorina starrii]|uniref:Uncharacterized protein n=1 Tax=Pleodorina starrii TaxID=330485 RepID=A0A9W6BH55_9CHLO|nr:hypothetical protein PLESTM_000291700 [Pleodorina starrii]GLC51954.1 hypothetical protein PLESTB_000566500 [Pleodorina starrii]GLC68532.1 hypothetical protein PLESTF_000702300 [Pleodorina starrii]